eukprot:1460908-Rhodomonas_salina.2
MLVHEHTPRRTSSSSEPPPLQVPELPRSGSVELQRRAQSPRSASPHALSEIQGAQSHCPHKYRNQ